MTTPQLPADPARFDLNSFADLLPKRLPLVGEDPDSFDAFRDELMQSLLPATPYEGVMADNLIFIEWDILQHRRMRDAGVRQSIRNLVFEAVMIRERQAFDAEAQADLDAHIEDGGYEYNWDKPKFDEDAAIETANDIAERCRYADAKGMLAVAAELEGLGRDTLEVMAEAYRETGPHVSYHEEKLQELERRRREVKRDYDALQQRRPIDMEVIEG